MAEQALLDAIPSLDLSTFTHGTPEQKAKFVADLGQAYNDIGFVSIKGHGLSDDLQADLYRLTQAFFAQPVEDKLKCFTEELAGQRGYTPNGREHAKGFKEADLKEFYQVGQDLAPSDPDYNTPDYPTNVWPAHPVEFSTKVVEAYRTLEAAGKQMLRAIALYLGLEETYFDDKVYHGNSILRCIHYPPIANPEAIPPTAVRAAAHGDINLITLLMGASADGLQVLRRDGTWIGITAVPNQLVVNVGDMLDRLTNHKLKSTIHQVVNPPREKMNTPRYSIPFFMHPRSEVDLTCLASCVDAKNPKLYVDMTAGEFLDERLREIGLKN
jgi:isopenicillin N synthase-like dioxygenase